MTVVSSYHPKIEQRRFPLYLWLLIFQILSLISNLVIVPGSKEDDYLITPMIAGFIDLFISLTLTIVSLFFLYHFVNKKWYFYTLATALVLSTITVFTITVIGLQQTNFHLFRQILGCTTFVTLVMLFTSFYEVVIDVFSENMKIRDALLGASNIVMLIILVFTFIFAMIGIIIPNSVVPDAEISRLYNVCYIHSAYIVGSMDLPDNDFKGFMENALVLESIFTHLFEVFIVGRLLSKL